MRARHFVGALISWTPFAVIRALVSLAVSRGFAESLPRGGKQGVMGQTGFAGLAPRPVGYVPVG